MMKKKFGVTAAALVLAVSLSSQAFAASSFTDIASSSSKTQIEALQQQGIIKGVSATAFHPEEQLTAAQGISLIVRATQISLAAIDFSAAPTADGYYTNVSNDAWYANDFIIAHYNGLDIPADIDPNAVLTKEQFVHYLVQAVEKTGEYALIKMYIQIVDEEAITVDYQGTIQRALLYKFTELDAEGKFDPVHVLTRAESAAMLYEARAFIDAHQNAVPDEPQPEPQQ